MIQAMKLIVIQLLMSLNPLATHYIITYGHNMFAPQNLILDAMTKVSDGTGD